MKLFHHMKSILGNQKGIALLIVLSSLSIMTMAIVEFAYTSRINYRMAIQAKERLQAYYLARSALNFSKILLKYNKEAQKTAGEHADQLGGMKLEPLYRMVPLSSALLRSAMSGELSGLLGGGDEGGEESGEEKSDQIKQSMGMIDQTEAQKFLDFDGDFSSEITEEQTKFDLNRFFGVETQSPAYDLRKRLLLSILKLPRFDKIFEDKREGREELVHAIADWVDTNGVINEFDQVQRGSENSQYDQETKVKNGKMLTIEELRLVAGMTDELFTELKPFVTVYSGDDRINLCYAEEDMVRALIYHFTHFSGCSVSSVEFDDEKMKELVDEVLAACPDVEMAARSVEAKLGLVDSSSVDPTAADPLENDPQKSPRNSKNRPVQAPPENNGCTFRFKNLLTGDNKVFYVKAIGEVGETRLTIHTVLSEGGKGNDFTTLYFRLE